MKEHEHKIKQLLLENKNLIEHIQQNFIRKIQQTALLQAKCIQNGGKLLICGNGGSAADSQHFAGELVGRFLMERDAIPAIALTTNTSIITALANDYSYENIFGRQVEALASPNDLLILLSTSGRSSNLLYAAKVAKKKNIQIIALLGKTGGPLLDKVDHSIVLPAISSPRIQEGHITIIHIWCDLIETILFKDTLKSK